MTKEFELRKIELKREKELSNKLWDKMKKDRQFNRRMSRKCKKIYDKPVSRTYTNEFLSRSTLDIDTTDKEFIKHIQEKIMKCRFSQHLELIPSSLKGVHLILYCKRNCCICRIVFDDFRRLAYDLNRPPYARNILFETKEKVKVRNAL